MIPFLDQLPPHDIAAEESVVAAVLVDPEAAELLLPGLKPTAFFREKHADIWKAARDVFQSNNGEAVNQITVAYRLSELGLLEGIGGQTFLADLIRRMPTSVGAEHWGGIVRETSHRRAMISELRGTLDRLYGPNGDAAQATTDLFDKLSRLQAARTKPISRLAWDVGADYEPTLRAWMGNPNALLGPSWGYRFLDEATHGMRPCLAMLLARTGVGKSLLAMNIARNVTNQDEYVLMFTTEMSDTDSFGRNMFMTAGLNQASITRRGEVTDYERAVIEEAFADTRGRPMVLSGSSWDLRTLVSDVRRRNAEYGCRVVIIDHIDKITTHKGATDHERVIEAMDTLMKLAEELGVCILFVSHSNNEGGKEPWPRISHAKWGGEKGNDCSVGITLAPARWVDGAGWMPVDRGEAAKMRRWGTLVVRLSLEKNRFGFEGDSYVIQDWKRGGVMREVSEDEARDYCAQYDMSGTP